MKKLAQLMTLEEMQERFQKKDDPFDLTIEKWGRIRKFLDTTLTLDDFRKLFEASTVAVPFCFEFDVKHCVGCPLGEICGHGEEENKSQRLNRLIRAYALAGDMLPKQSLATQVDNFLEMIKQKSKGTSYKKHKLKNS